MRVVGSQEYLALGEILLEQVDGPVEPPHRETGAGEVIARGEGVRVVGSQNALTVNQGLLEHIGGQGELARVPVGAREIAA